MKYFWFPIALLALLLAATLWAGAAVRDTVEPWCAALTSASDAARRGDWDAAERALHTVETAWERTSALYHTFIEHDELDDAEELLTRARSALSARDGAAFAAETGALITQLRVIAEMQGLSVQNVL